MSRKSASRSKRARIVRPGSLPATGTSQTVSAVGPWQPLQRVSEGQFTCVYRARPAGRDERPASYALKVLRDACLDDATAQDCLRREAVVGKQVCHPHLVPVLSAHVTGPPHYLVMPWLAGATLAQRLEAGAATPLPVALWLARQVAEALDALWQAGWMHADVKPANILVSPQGHATLVDLGFARRAGEDRALSAATIAGTVGYLAPETLTSKLRPDIRSDIFSLGATLYELLGGRRPFAAQSLEELADEHRQEQPRELRSLNPRLPIGVCRLVRQMLAKEPLRRPQTPRELAQRLTALEIETFAERTA